MEDVFQPIHVFNDAHLVQKRPANFNLHFLWPRMQVESHPYLGVEIDNKMTWSTHIKNTINKANRTLGFLRRNLWFCTREVKICTYNMLVLPVLEYACEVWDPFVANQKQRLEMVHRRAARFCSSDFKKYSSVTTMMTNLGWETLEERRKKIRLTMLYKIANGLVGIDCDQYLTMAKDKRTRGSTPECTQGIILQPHPIRMECTDRGSNQFNVCRGLQTAPLIKSSKNQCLACTSQPKPLSW